MEWSDKLIKWWCDNYYSIRERELNPFAVRGVFGGEEFTRGRPGYNSPYEEVVDMNIDFDRALRKLGDKEKLFRSQFIDGDEPKDELWEEFIEILKEE